MSECIFSAKKFDFGEAEVTATGAVEAGQRQACLELTTDPAKDMDLVMIRDHTPSILDDFLARSKFYKSFVHPSVSHDR